METINKVNQILIEKIAYNLGHDGFLSGFKWIREDSQPKGAILISHGMAEHIERYDEFAKLLANNNYVVFGHNQRGHKDSIPSDNDYGYMGENDNFQIMVDDLSEISDIIKKQYPDIPLFLFGHSMGSFVSERFTQLYGNKINGLILSGANLQPNGILNLGIFIASTTIKLKGRKYRSKFLDKMSFGAFNSKFKPNRTDYDWLNRDDAEVDKYIADKYCGGIFSTAYFRDFLKGIKDINRNNDLIPKSLPILIISGSMDPVGGMSKGITKLYNTYMKLSINDLTFKLYEGARHEILLEKNKEEVKNDILNWLNERTK